MVLTVSHPSVPAGEFGRGSDRAHIASRDGAPDEATSQMNPIDMPPSESAYSSASSESSSSYSPPNPAPSSSLPKQQQQQQQQQPPPRMNPWGAPPPHGGGVANTDEKEKEEPVFGTSTPSLSMIMTEQAEQERILSGIQMRKQEKEQELQEQQRNATSRAGAEEDEEALLRRIMQQSLDEYRGQQDPKSAPELETHAPAVAAAAAAAIPPSSRFSRMNSMRSLGSVSEHAPSIPPSLTESPVSTSMRSHMTDRSFSQRALKENERTETIVLTPRSADQERQRRLSASSSSSGNRDLKMPPAGAIVTSRSVMLKSARGSLSNRELTEIERALKDADRQESQRSLSSIPNLNHPSEIAYPVASVAAAASIPAVASQGAALSSQEAAAIEAALREADQKENEESVRLALQMQQEEMDREAAYRLSLGDEPTAPGHQRQSRQGNIRTMTRAQLDQESQRVGAVYSAAPPARHPLEAEADPVRATAGVRTRPIDDDEHDHGYDEEYESAGFRMNAAANGQQQQWNRRDRNTIVGPNNEVRTKHDVQVQNQSNAQRLALEADEFGYRTNVSSRAYNSFQSNMKKAHGTTKGVATHGTGRGGADSSGTKGKALDDHVRLEISRAINAGLIEKMNGAVKQGKEAVVYHAVKGGGADVAVKVFKRITDFRSRGDYVVGDPRYSGRAYPNVGGREKLNMWCEKEFRNLVRANRAGVPVPTPLDFKENVLYMRFLGDEGWPSPQLREIDLRQGSKKWSVLYAQVMESLRRLYSKARLVHGDLSEYNILVAPASRVQNHSSGIEDANLDLQTVLIDFGQAVDSRHPESESLLLRDIANVRKFFLQKGVKDTMSVNDSLEMITADVEEEESDANDSEDDDDKGSFPDEPAMSTSKVSFVETHAVAP